MRLVKLFGSRTCCTLVISQVPRPSSTLTTKLIYTLQQIQSSMNIQNTLKLIVILSENEYYLVRLFLGIFPPMSSGLIYALRHWIIINFDTCLASWVFQSPQSNLRGSIRILLWYYPNFLEDIIVYFSFPNISSCIFVNYLVTEKFLALWTLWLHLYSAQSREELIQNLLPNSKHCPKLWPPYTFFLVLPLAICR